MPFNMNTFSKLWGVVTPDEAREKIEAQRGVVTGEPKNLEEQAIRLVGTDIYAKLIKGYTEKQWGDLARSCRHSSSSVSLCAIRMTITILTIRIRASR